jgi:anti-sigma factor RsiW
VHPFGDLSAYLDGALSAEARASVQAHLDTCALCRSRLAELRGTARLIAALPIPVPSRSLVPRVSIPFWLAPLRTLSTVASGAAVFLFLISVVSAGLPFGSQSAAPAAAPAASAAGAPEAAGGGAATSATVSPDFKLSAPSPVPGAATDQQRSAAGRTDDAKNVTGRQGDSASPSGPPTDALSRQSYSEPTPLRSVPTPLVWLILAVAFGVLSFILGRRLRSA